MRSKHNRKQMMTTLIIAVFLVLLANSNAFAVVFRETDQGEPDIWQRAHGNTLNWCIDEESFENIGGAGWATAFIDGTRDYMEQATADWEVAAQY